MTIPAYEDADLLPTIERALANADVPGSIHFAIALQYKWVPTPDLSKYHDSPNFNFLSYDVDTRPGVNQVRHNLLKFYDNQDYFMMIDSHTKFMRGWDTALINDYKKLQNLTHDRVALSRQIGSSPGNMCTCNNKDEFCIGHDAATKWNATFGSDYVNEVLSITGNPNQNINIENRGKEFVWTGYACCNFFFTNSDFVKEVGILDNLSFSCEESSLSLRAFFSGWDIYSQSLTAYTEHAPQQYNLALYGEEAPKHKMYAKWSDYAHGSNEERRNLTDLFLFNSGVYETVNKIRTPKEFYIKAGLTEYYDKLQLAMQKE
ncbi:MAG: hypothetical protein RLZZ196_180 [Bacteroidota bacterium]|jgi:hypothetical protein